MSNTAIMRVSAGSLVIIGIVITGYALPELIKGDLQYLIGLGSSFLIYGITSDILHSSLSAPRTAVTVFTAACFWASGSCFTIGGTWLACQSEVTIGVLYIIAGLFTSVAGHGIPIGRSRGHQ